MALSHFDGESPIQRLPVELLRDIFAFCISELPSTDISEAPLLLCHVCSHWRAVAIDSARLWTTFRLELFNIPVEDEVENRRLTDPLFPITWMRCCKDAGINLEVVISYTREKQPWYQHQTSFLTRLTSSIPAFRFHSLTFNQVSIDALISLPKGVFPFLHRLVLHTPDLDFNFGEEECEASTCVLDLCATHMENLQFAHFGVGNHTSGNPHGLAKQATFYNLKGLSLSYWFLSLARVRGPDMLWSFDFPDLRYLGIHIYWHKWSILRGDPFLTKLAAFKALERLAITSARLPISTIEILLACLPQLQTLELDIWQGLINISKALTLVPAGGSGNLVPTLKSLILDIGYLDQSIFDHYGVSQDDPDQQVKELQSMVASRRNLSYPNNRLEKIVLYTEVHESMEHTVKALLQCLNPFVQEGLELEHHLVCGSRKDGIGEYWYERAQPDISDWPQIAELFTIVDY
ncbi:hypothetical protein BKA70DRAFT_1556263 [Coprinopsis sp. MPI-PUGE-AT-0042]|nr:hypothetical protein BKA70DRAFT_1556263 [Coprinopsis sp. MPI-PUGE-AT-0042]